MPLGRRRNWHRIRVRLTTPHRRGHSPSRRHLGSTHAGPKRGHASVSETAHAQAGSSGWKAPSGRAVRIEDHVHCKRPQHTPGDKSRPSGGRLGPSSGGSISRSQWLARRAHSLLSSSESDCGKIDMEGEGRKVKSTENGDLIPNVRAEEQIMVQNQNEAVRDWSVRSEQPRGRRRGRAAGRQRWGAAGRLCPWRGRPHRASSSGR